jgi:hypothetical protein
LASVTEKRELFRALCPDSPVGAGVFTEKATCARFFIDSEIAIPGKGPFRTGRDTRLGFTGKTEMDFFLFRPVGLDANPCLFGRDGAFMREGTDHFTDSATSTERRDDFQHMNFRPPLNPKQRG